MKKPFKKNQAPILLQTILTTDSDLLNFALGSFGLQLKKFVENVDFQHPEIANIFDGCINDDKSFAQECVELLTLGKFAKENNLNRIIPELSKVITSKNASSFVLKKIDSPINNRLHVRLIKDKNVREEIRLSKKMQIIDLQSFYKKNDEFWNLQPDSFKKFIRFSLPYNEDIEIAEKKLQRYKELGCVSLCEEIESSIKMFKENMENSYYGFNRITLVNASIILAKNLGYTYKQTQKNIPSKITISKNFFSDYDFTTTWQENDFSYAPRIYPLYLLKDMISKDIENTINLLENFPDADGKPIFDHYAVLVPSIDYPIANKEFYSFCDPQGMVRIFSNRFEALENLDKILLSKKYFNGILLGEKNGKCYFITYFS